MKRQAIVDKALEYMGTPFQHQGRIKGHALDCVGLPLMVGNDLGLSDKNGVPFGKRDDCNYQAQPIDDSVLMKAKARLIEKPKAEWKPGDVIIFRNPRNACHAGIATTVGVVHGYGGGTRKVVHHRIDEKWSKRIAGVFEFPGVED